jgi:hypothetical protein
MSWRRRRPCRALSALPTAAAVVALRVGVIAEIVPDRDVADRFDAVDRGSRPDAVPRLRRTFGS